LDAARKSSTSVFVGLATEMHEANSRIKNAGGSTLLLKRIKCVYRQRAIKVEKGDLRRSGSNKKGSLFSARARSEFCRARVKNTEQ
jgi:hypothetical protein